MICPLEYIPTHLHTESKPLVEEFVVGEQLYYRCKGEFCKKPYDNISLYDISHNRNFNSPDLYNKEDVLYNILPDDPLERYENLNISTLVITKITNDITYIKELVSSFDVNLKVVIKLIHQPVACMYPHCVFEISINNQVITSDNYNDLLNKRNKTYKSLRKSIRQEITSLIQSGQIDDSVDIEIIDIP